MSINRKTITTVAIVISIVLAFLLVKWVVGVVITNKAIKMEEMIDKSDVEILNQKKKMNTLISNLVDVVIQNSDYEQSTLIAVINARTSNQERNGENINITNDINIVAEQYPQLQANQSYNNLMLELSRVENDLNTLRDNRTQKVTNYNTYVRSEPVKSILRSSGYEFINYEHLSYKPEEVEDLNNIFGK